jgi:hypothetical protein
MVETLVSRKQHRKTKPAVIKDCNKYKIGVEKLNQMLAYNSFQMTVVEESSISLICLR